MVSGFISLIRTKIIVIKFVKLMRLEFCERSDTKLLVELIPTKEGSLRKFLKFIKLISF